MNEEKKRLEEILEQHLSVTDEWGGTKLAEWKYGHAVLVGGIEEAVCSILFLIAEKDREAEQVYYDMNKAVIEEKDRAEQAEAQLAEKDREIAGLREQARLREADVWQAEADRDRWKAQAEQLEKALLGHRADLHQYSKRPCPTCRESAIALGIQNKVPNCCAREETDRAALEDEE